MSVLAEKHCIEFKIQATKVSFNLFFLYWTVQSDRLLLTPLHYDEVLGKAEAIALSGWIPPAGVIIKGYCNDFKPRAGMDNLDNGEFPGRIRHYRLLAKERSLPGKSGLVRCLHIRGGIGSEHMEWAIAVFLLLHYSNLLYISLP